MHNIKKKEKDYLSNFALFAVKAHCCCEKMYNFALLFVRVLLMRPKASNALLEMLHVRVCIPEITLHLRLFVASHTHTLTHISINKRICVHLW